MPLHRRSQGRELTVSEIATAMGKHVNSVLWNIKEGYLPARFDGYKYLIRRIDYLRWKNEFYDDLPNHDDDQDGD